MGDEHAHVDVFSCRRSAVGRRHVGVLSWRWLGRTHDECTFAVAPDEAGTAAGLAPRPNCPRIAVQSVSRDPERPYGESDDSYEENDRASDSFFPYTGSWGWGSALPSVYGTDETVNDEGASDESRYDDRYDEATTDEEGTWLDEGVISLILLAGVVLFFFPEPATSALGILLLGVGVVAWIADALA